jgi:biopolymer transport protein ExbB/TolQ
MNHIFKNLSHKEEINLMTTHNSLLSSNMILVIMMEILSEKRVVRRFWCCASQRVFTQHSVRSLDAIRRRGKHETDAAAAGAAWHTVLERERERERERTLKE